MKIQILIDNINSWIIPYSYELKEKLNEIGHLVSIVHEHNDVTKGDILFLLSCEQKFDLLHLNKNNIVVHESNLPKGKGWSPVSWQVLEGKTKIPICLFEANQHIDSGDIYLKDYFELDGTELWSEIKHKQGKKTTELILSYINNVKKLKGIKQSGTESFYSKRTQIDSELDINKSINEQFNLLRICDNERYPAYFKIKDVIYYLTINKEMTK